MKQLHPNAVPEPGSPREHGQPAPVLPAPPSWPEAPPRLPASASPSAEVLLDLSFRELVNFYRHSGCGRLCRGLAHRMNTPLQVLSFQLELLEHKSLEEQELLPEVRSPAGVKLQALHRYRLRRSASSAGSWQTSRSWCGISSCKAATKTPKTASI